MKGKDLIKFIQDNDLEDFNLYFSFVDGFNIFPNIRTFEINEISDIGYSEKSIHLEGKETN